MKKNNKTYKEIFIEAFENYKKKKISKKLRRFVIKY